MIKANLDQLLNKIEEKIDKSIISLKERPILEASAWWYSMPLGDYNVNVSPIATLFNPVHFGLRIRSKTGEKILEICPLTSCPENYLLRVEDIFYKMQEAMTGKEPEPVTSMKKRELQKQVEIKEFSDKYGGISKEVLDSLG